MPQQTSSDSIPDGRSRDALTRFGSLTLVLTMVITYCTGCSRANSSPSVPTPTSASSSSPVPDPPTPAPTPAPVTLTIRGRVTETPPTPNTGIDSAVVRVADGVNVDK